MFPNQLMALHPLIQSTPLVTSDEECQRWYAGLTTNSLAKYYVAMRDIWDRELLPEINEFINSDEDSGDKLFNLIFFMDYLVKNDLVPQELVDRPLIEWDHREQDDQGHEW